MRRIWIRAKLIPLGWLTSTPYHSSLAGTVTLHPGSCPPEPFYPTRGAFSNQLDGGGQADLTKDQRQEANQMASIPPTTEVAGVLEGQL